MCNMKLRSPLLLVAILLTSRIGGAHGSGSLVRGVADNEDEDVRQLQRVSRTSGTTTTRTQAQPEIDPSPAEVRTERSDTSSGTSRTGRTGTSSGTTGTTPLRTGRSSTTPGTTRTSRGGTPGTIRTRDRTSRGRGGTTRGRDRTSRGRGIPGSPEPARTGRTNQTPRGPRTDDRVNPKMVADAADCAVQEHFFGIRMFISNLIRNEECMGEIDQGSFEVEVERALKEAEDFMGDGATHITPLEMSSGLCSKQVVGGIWEGVGGATVKFGCKPDFEYANDKQRMLMQDAQELLDAAGDPTFGHLLVVHKSLLTNVLKTNLLEQFSGICFREHTIPELSIEISPHPTALEAQNFVAGCTV